jgi:hypothetical protein
MKKAWVNAILAGLGLAGAWIGDPRAAEPASPLLYEMTTETLMPHLEENLRYAVRKERRCVNLNDLSKVFWMLDEASLQDCVLVKSTEQADSALYLLKCNGGHGTTGDARWKLDPDAIKGTLKVRLGGKNMTFYQRISAKPVGTCS